VLECLRGHVVEVVPGVATGGGFEVAFVEDTGGREFHAQSGGAVKPFGVGGIAAEELVAGPAERMQVEYDCGLSGRFCVREHAIERNPGAVELMEVDSGGDGGDDGKFECLSIGQLQHSLASHTDSEECNFRWDEGECLLDPWQQGLEQPVLGRDDGVEFFAGDIQPPAAASRRTDGGQSMRVQKLGEDGIALESDFPVTVQKKHGAQERFGIPGDKNIDSATIDVDGLPGLQEFLDAGTAGRLFCGTCEEPSERVEHGGVALKRSGRVFCGGGPACMLCRRSLCNSGYSQSWRKVQVVFHG